MKLLFKSVLLMSMAVSLQSVASQEDLNAEKVAYIQVFSGADLEASEARAKLLEGSGWQDVAIFDVLEQQIVKNIAVSDGRSIDSVAWMLKALASSGNSKYLPTFDRVIAEGHKKLKKYAQLAKEQLPQFAATNALVAKNLEAAPAGRLEQQRIMNMLEATDAALQNKGVDRAYDKFSKGPAYDKALMDKLQARVLAVYKTEAQDKAELNARAYMCKALANTGDAAYKPTLTEVAANAADKKLRKYAEKFAAQLK